MKLPIYLDNHATTQVDPKVLEAMLPYFTEAFGNAASRNHCFGWEAEEAVEKARQLVADLINASAREIVFTSGATESDNLAIKGTARTYRNKGNQIVTAATEHKAVLDCCKHLELDDYRVTCLPVDRHGLIDLQQLTEAITPETILVSIMTANNEIGTIQPIREIGRICHEKGVLFHTDATQAVGKIPFDVEAANADLVSLSAHKMHGPKGVGALYVRRRNPRVRLTPIMDGGGHERGARSGTLNVPGIVGLGRACEIAQKEMALEGERLGKLRDRLKAGIQSRLEEVFLNGHPVQRLPNNLNFSFACVEAESLLMGISDIAVSSGSACTTAKLEPSYVLKAIGVPDELAHTSIRFGLGRFNTDAEIDYVVERVAETVDRLRSISPLWEMVRDGVDPKTVKWNEQH